MASAMDTLLRGAISNTNCCLPAIITAYDAATQKATVKPVLDVQLRTETTLELPEILGVPVMMVGTDNAGLQLPIAVNDSVLLLFADRSIDTILVNDSKKVRSSGDYRNHDYNDAIAIAGFKSYSEAHGTDDTTTLIMNKGLESECKLILKPSGASELITPKSSIVQDGAGTITSTNEKSSITQTKAGVITATNGKGTMTISEAGAVTLSNANGIISIAPSGLTTMQAGGASISISDTGAVTLSGTTLTLDFSSVTSTSDIVANSKSVATHTHMGDSGGTTSQPN